MHGYFRRLCVAPEIYVEPFKGFGHVFAAEPDTERIESWVKQVAGEQQNALLPDKIFAKRLHRLPHQHGESNGARPGTIPGESLVMGRKETVKPVEVIADDSHIAPHNCVRVP
jgi:hypothetical protein